MAAAPKPTKAKGLKKNFFDISSPEKIVKFAAVRRPLNRFLRKVGAEREAKFATIIVGSDGKNLQSRIDKARKVLKLRDLNSGLLVAQSQNAEDLIPFVSVMPKIAYHKFYLANALRKVRKKPVAGRNIKNATYYVVFLTQGANSDAA